MISSLLEQTWLDKNALDLIKDTRINANKTNNTLQIECCHRDNKDKSSSISL